MRTRPIVPRTLAAGVLLLTVGCGSGTPTATTSSGSPAPAPALPSASSAASPSPATPAGDWLGFRGDASHTGNGPAGPSGRPVVNWQYHARAAVPHAVSVVGDLVSFASDDGTVYALDRASGAERWMVDLGDAPLIGPWAADGRLYFRNGAGAALAADATSGKVLWRTPGTYGGSTEPVADHGVLYLTTDDGRIAAIDGATGTEAWSVKPGPSIDWIGNPAVANGRIYAGTSAGFVAVDVASHAVVWTGLTNGEQTGSASVNEGMAFIATGGDSTTGRIRAFDAVTGRLAWSSADERLTFPVVADGTVLSSTMDGLVEALDLHTGARRWSIQLSGRIRPMAVADHVLYIPADSEHRIYAVDIATGGTRWTFDVDDSNDCCIAVTDGAIYVATMAGSVYSIGGDGSAITAGPPASSAPSPTSIASPTAAPLGRLDVRQAWSADLRGMGISPAGQIAVDPATGRVWVPEALGNGFAIVDPDGVVVDRWAGAGGPEGPFDFTRQNGDGYGTIAFARDGSLFVLDVGNRRVLHFSAKRKLIGQWGSFGEQPGQFSDPVGIAAAPDGSVWVLDDRRSVVEHYTAGGKVLGSFDPFATTPRNDGANSLFVAATGTLSMSGAAPAQVYRFDAGGAFIDAVGPGLFDEQAGSMAVDAKGRLFVTQGPERGDAPGVLVFAPDGTPIGGFAPSGPGDGQIVFPGGIALDGHGGVYVFDSLPDSARLVTFTLPTALR